MPARFAGLDRLKGIALWAMLLHHALMWMVGDARTKLGGGSSMAVTDLAAPMFAVSVGAGAALLARRLRNRRGAGTGRTIARWATIGAWGVLLGAVIDHQVDSVGVLETLAACGLVVTMLALVAAPTAATWAAIAVALTALSLPVIRLAGEAGGWWALTFGDSFPALSYLAMAAAGAALAAQLGDSERRAALDRAALGGMVGLGLLAATGVAVWPVDRYPSGPAFVVPGVVASVAIWAVLARMRPGPMVRGLERAGRRTLVVYVAHYALRIVLDLGGWWAALRGPWWTAAAVAVAIGMAALSALPWPLRPPPAGDDARSAQERDRDLQLARS